MHKARGITKLLLAGMIVAFGLAMWGAGRAAANCPASDPNCMGGGDMSNPTSPPHTNPPSNGGGTPSVTSNKNSSSSHSTQPPVVRTTPATARRTPATQPRRTVQPQVQAPVEDFVPTPAAANVIQPGPAIALYGDPPAGGIGTAAGTPLPPAPPEESGAGKVLWAFGIGVGAVGIGIGAAATLKSGAGLAAGGSTLEPVA